jgi:putative transposase
VDAGFVIFIVHHKVKTIGFSRSALAAIIAGTRAEASNGLQIWKSYGFQIEYHFVWVTKYRYKVLEGEIAERVRELVRQTCEAFEIKIVKGVVSKDHVHILVSCPPTMAPSEIMRRIKGRTSNKLFEEYSHLKKRYWGRHFWARGYFCATVGQMTEEMIKQYLEHHFEPNPNADFKVE